MLLLLYLSSRPKIDLTLEIDSNIGAFLDRTSIDTNNDDLTDGGWSEIRSLLFTSFDNDTSNGDNYNSNKAS